MTAVSEELKGEIVCPKCGKPASEERAPCPQCGTQRDKITDPDRTESWLEAIASFLLVIIGLFLFVGGSFFAWLVSRSSASTGDVSPDPAAGETIAVSIIVALIGLGLLIVAFWKPRK